MLIVGLEQRGREALQYKGAHWFKGEVFILSPWASSSSEHSLTSSSQYITLIALFETVYDWPGSCSITIIIITIDPCLTPTTTLSWPWLVQSWSGINPRSRQVAGHGSSTVMMDRGYQHPRNTLNWTFTLSQRSNLILSQNELVPDKEKNYSRNLLYRNFTLLETLSSMQWSQTSLRLMGSWVV